MTTLALRSLRWTGTTAKRESVWLTLVALLLGLVTLGIDDLTVSVLLLAAASGVIQYALAFWLYLFALQDLPANVAGFYMALIPVFGIAAAFVFLGETLSPLQLVGALFVVIAIAAISRLRHE